MTKYLIVNADDLGISVPVNLAIRRASRSGIVTSASLLANMPAFRHAVEEVARPEPPIPARSAGGLLRAAGSKRVAIFRGNRA